MKLPRSVLTDKHRSFRRLRESGRDELFEKAKGEILDEVVNLSQTSAKKWEDLLTDKLWEKLSNYVFENIYLPAAQSGSESNFELLSLNESRTFQWMTNELPFCVQIHSTPWSTSN